MLCGRVLFNKAGYTVNKQSLAGGQRQYAEGQWQSISGLGRLCSEITNTVNFAAFEISRYGH